MSGLRRVRVADKAKVLMGQSPPSSACSGNGDGLPFLQGNAEFGPRHPLPRLRCSIPTRIAEAGDLLLSVRAPVGELNQAKSHTVIGRGLSAIRFPEVDQSFAWHAMKWSASDLARAAQGSTFVAVARPDVEGLEIPWFETKENRRIAAVLDTVDEAIAKTEAVIAKLKQVRAGLLHDLLTRGLDEHGQLRDPVAHPEQFHDILLGRIPIEWSAGNLSDLTQGDRPIVYGILMPGRGFRDGIPVIKVKDIQDGRIDISDLLLTDPRIDEAYHRSRVLPNDLLFTIRGTVGRMALVPPELANANITQDTARVSLAWPNPEFIARWLETETPSRFVNVHTIGVAVRGINLRDVRRIPVPIVPRPEQDAIVACIDAHERQMDQETKNCEKLKLVKSGLMTDLLTGRVRVPSDLVLAAE